MVYDLFEEPSSPLFHWLLLQASAPCFADPGSHPLTTLKRGSFVAEMSCFFSKTKRTKKMMMRKTMTKKMMKKRICWVEVCQKIGIATLDSLRVPWW